MKPRTVALTLLGAAAGLGAAGWLGLQTKPNPFPAPAAGPLNALPSPPMELPAPVVRHYRLAFGAHFPHVQTALFLGRSRIRTGLWMPMRFAAYHRLGYDFVRRMEVTWFNIPFLKGVDSYVDGAGVMNINGAITKGPEIDQGANLAMWCEALIFPSALNVPGVRWTSMDRDSAILTFPFGDETDQAVIYFDPVTGFMRRCSAWRYKAGGDSKVQWHVTYLGWRQMGAFRFPERVQVEWQNEDGPWFVAEIDEVVLNVDVSEALALGRYEEAGPVAPALAPV